MNVEYYGHNDYRDYHLEHYGVKGMKWKKRKRLSLEQIKLLRRRRAALMKEKINRDKDRMMKDREMTKKPKKVSSAAAPKAPNYDYNLRTAAVSNKMVERNGVNLTPNVIKATENKKRKKAGKLAVAKGKEKSVTNIRSNIKSYKSTLAKTISKLSGGIKYKLG